MTCSFQAMLLLALATTTCGRRMTEEGDLQEAVRRPPPSSLAVLNQSRTGKELLWGKIDEFARRSSDGRPSHDVLFFDEGDVQGTIGQSIGSAFFHGFNKMKKGPYFDQEIEIFYTNRDQGRKSIKFLVQTGYTKSNGQVLIFQSTGDSITQEKNFQDVDLQGLLSDGNERLLNIQLNINVEISGLFKDYRLYKGYRPQPFTVRRISTKEGAWFGRFVAPERMGDIAALDGPCGDVKENTTRKLVIPLEYNDEKARIWNAKRDWDVKPMMGYRRGLLYFRYVCGITQGIRSIKVQKASIMLSLEQNATYAPFPWYPSRSQPLHLRLST